MLRLRARFAGSLLIVALATLALTGCGSKGPLVPAAKPSEAAPAALPPPPAITPAIPSATLPSTPQPAP